MNVLLIHPRFPDTFWGFRHALRFVSRKASQPPLGLLTVAAMLPRDWTLKLVDMNVLRLTDADLEWADLALVSAVSVQERPARAILQRCREHGLRTVAGGPLFTADPGSFPEADHLVLGEAETSLGGFLADLAAGNPADRYGPGPHPELSLTPVPMWELVDFGQYATLSIQYSRGCPYDCEFCDITVLYGRKVRTKNRAQVLAELDLLHGLGWRDDVFFVDDNFIGNRRKLKREILPAIRDWMNAHGRPFRFHTEASLDLADDPELMDQMTDAGFDSVFVGIETTHAESLAECGKKPNQGRDLLGSVRRLQAGGLNISAGFILGFDHDPPTIFEQLGTFIQKSGITTAMIGLLNAPRNTRLYHRLQREGRLRCEITGDNTDNSLNFEPRMDRSVLLAGYHDVLARIYSPAGYYERLRRFLDNFQPRECERRPLRIRQIGALLRSMFVLGIKGKERLHYWKLWLWTISHRPRLFPTAITLSIYGFHFRKHFEQFM